MTIINGSLAEADEIMNMTGQMFKNQSNLLWNANLIGFDSEFLINLKNIFYNATLTDFEGSGATFVKAPVMPRGLIDEHNNSSVDATLWTTTGTVTETSTYMRVYAEMGTVGGTATSSATLNGASAPAFGTSSYIIRFSMVKHNSSSGGGGNGTYCQLLIYDGSASVAIRTLNTLAIGSTITEPDTVYRLNIDKVGETCNFTTDITDTSAIGINLSALNNGNNWYFRLFAQAEHSAGGSGTDYAYVDEFVISTLSALTTATFIFGTHTATESVTNAIPALSTTGSGGTPIYSLSANNGVGYTVINDAEIVRPTAGTQLRLKSVLTASNATYPTVTRVNHYAIGYNFY